MRKIITLLAVVGMLALQGCVGPEGPPGYDGIDGEDGLIAEVFELNNRNFVYDNELGYIIYEKLTPKIYSSDIVLIYRLSETIGNGIPVWQLIPRTLFLPNGELDYDFDFSEEDFTIYAGGTYNLAMTPGYINNQTFRIVIVPGYFSTTINKSNYSEVVSALNIKESEIKKIRH